MRSKNYKVLIFSPSQPLLGRLIGRFYNFGSKRVFYYILFTKIKLLNENKKFSM